MCNPHFLSVVHEMTKRRIKEKQSKKKKRVIGLLETKPICRLYAHNSETTHQQSKRLKEQIKEGQRSSGRRSAILIAAATFFDSPTRTSTFFTQLKHRVHLLCKCEYFSIQICDSYAVEYDFNFNPF